MAEEYEKTIVVEHGPAEGYNLTARVTRDGSVELLQTRRFWPGDFSKAVVPEDRVDEIGMNVAKFEKILTLWIEQNPVRFEKILAVWIQRKGERREVP